MPAAKWFVGSQIARRTIVEAPMWIKNHRVAKVKCNICKHEEHIRLDNLIAKRSPTRCPGCIQRGFL